MTVVAPSQQEKGQAVDPGPSPRLWDLPCTTPSNFTLEVLLNCLCQWHPPHLSGICYGWSLPSGVSQACWGDRRSRYGARAGHVGAG